MGLTEWTARNTPHISGVMILGVAAYCAPMLTVLGVECKALSQKRDITNVWLEFAGAFSLAQAAGFNGLFLWMNQSWGRHLKEREEKMREVKEDKRRSDTEQRAEGERLSTLG